MPVFTAAAKNTILEALGVTSLSLHTAYSATGANEVVGGLPLYARQPVTFSPAAVGLKAALPIIPFDVPLTTTVAWVGMWNAGSAFLGMVPAGGDIPRPFALDDPLTGILKCSLHGFLTGDSLVVWAGDASLLPNGLAEGTIYYAIASTPNTLQLSLTGLPLQTAILPPIGGNGFLQRIVPVVYAAQGTFPVTAFILDATVAT